jgi:hypothetical protein
MSKQKAIYLMGQDPDIDAAIKALDNMDEEVEALRAKAKAHHRASWNKIKSLVRARGLLPEGTKNPVLQIDKDRGVLYSSLYDKDDSDEGPASEFLRVIKEVLVDK